MTEVGYETIEEWAKWEREEIDRFVSYWESRMKEDPATYPAAVPDGEFDEQYRIYESI